MGTSYDLRCIDCGEDAGISASWDPIRLSAVEPFVSLVPGLGSTPDVPGLQCELDGLRIDLGWCRKHATHRIGLVTEYGEVIGSCSKRIVCPTCKCDRGYCDLDKDHAGECGKRPKEPAR
jgi:hypothetical protein